MISLKEVKLKIFNTNCKEYLLEGFSCSEPILTKDNQGLIDNYFIYAANDKETEVTQPFVSFGIYSELEQTAYVNRLNAEGITRENKKEECADKEHLYAEYVELYGKVRSFAFEDCTKEQKKELRDYLTALKTLSGTALWDCYQAVAPMFFEWAKNTVSFKE